MIKSVGVQDPVGAIASLDEPNRRKLYALLVEGHEPLGRDEAAAATGISRELAAFHLDRLVEVGLLTTEYKHLGSRRGPGAGRPAKLYRRAVGDLAVSLPQRDYARAGDLLADALERLEDDGRSSVRAAVADVARTRGTVAGIEARRNAGRRPSPRGLRAALLALLRDAGYEPKVVAETGGIGLHSCPFDALVATHRDLTCGMNAAWAEGVTEGLRDSGLHAQLAPAQGWCCVRFEAAPPPKQTPGDRRPAQPSGKIGKDDQRRCA